MRLQDAERYQKLKAHFLRTHAISGPGKEQYLEELTALDSELGEALRRLLLARENCPEVLKVESIGELLPQPDAGTVELPGLEQLIAGRYRVKEKLGSGARSTVFLCCDERLANNRVALKFFHGVAEKIGEQVGAEIGALARIRHTGISGIVDAGLWAERTPFLVQQYWEGKTLRERMQEGPIPRGNALRILEQVAEILEAAHAAGVLHLDLKPENIVLDLSGRVSVVDFGQAQFESLTREGGFGTPGYMAPEQLDGKPSRATDVYAVARVAEEILGEVNGRARRVLRRGWSPKPEERPAGVKNLVMELEAALQPMRWGWWAAGAAAAALLWWAGIRWQAGREEWNFAALTVQKGVELKPTFSPDGEYLYYVHGSTPRAPRMIMRQRAGGSEAEAVVEEAAIYVDVALSRQGEKMAYVRRRGTKRDRELVLRDLGTGGEELLLEGNVGTISFGPNGGWLIVEIKDGEDQKGRLYRLDLADRRLEAIFTAPAGVLWEGDASLSDDGTQLAYVRCHSEIECDLLWVRLNEEGRVSGKEQIILEKAKGVSTPRWEKGGASVLYLGGNPRQRRLRRKWLNGGEEEISAAGDALGGLAVDAQSGRVAVVKEVEDSDVYRMKIPYPPEESDSAMERVFASAALDEEAKYSPDGDRIVFLSDRSGDLQMWEGRQGQNHVRQLTKVKGAQKAVIHWLPGKEARMFGLVPGLLQEIRELVETGGFYGIGQGLRLAGISRNGEWIYVSRESEQEQQLERWRLDGGKTMRMGIRSAAVVEESEEEGKLYWARRDAGAGLFEWSVGSGSKKVVNHLMRRNLFRVRNGWLYYVSGEPEIGIYAQPLGGGRVVMIKRLDKTPGWGLDVAPDGRELLLSLLDYAEADIYITQQVH